MAGLDDRHVKLGVECGLFFWGAFSVGGLHFLKNRVDHHQVGVRPQPGRPFRSECLEITAKGDIIENRLSRFDFHYLIGTTKKTEHFVERHELGLFEREEMDSAITSAGLERYYDEIWVYGLPQICEPLKGLKLPGRVKQTMTYTGYLKRRLPKTRSQLRLEKIRGPYLLITVGGLICNDMWANPGCTPMPDTHLSRQLSKMGAKIIFHAVNGGRDAGEWSENVNWHYHESNLRMRARAGGLWIATVDNCHPSELRCSAPSGVIDPTGGWVCRAEPKGEQYFAYSINLSG